MVGVIVNDFDLWYIYLNANTYYFFRLAKRKILKFRMKKKICLLLNKPMRILISCKAKRRRQMSLMMKLQNPTKKLLITHQRRQTRKEKEEKIRIRIIDKIRKRIRIRPNKLRTKMKTLMHKSQMKYSFFQ